MTICERFDNLVAFATDTIYNYKIRMNDKELKLREGKRISDEEEYLLSFLERVVNSYKLEEAVDYDDQEDEW